MSRLELLPAELRDIVLSMCSPREVRSLISASPRYLQDFTHNRSRILRPLIETASRSLPLHTTAAWIFSAATLRLQREDQATWNGDEARGRALRTCPQKPIDINLHAMRHNIQWQKLPVLIHLLDLADETAFLTVQLEPHTAYAQRRAPGSWDAQRGLLTLELYCQTVLAGNGVLAPDIAASWRSFFCVPHQDPWTHVDKGLAPQDRFYVAFHSALRKHRDVLRGVARDLGVTERPVYCVVADEDDDDNAPAPPRRDEDFLAVYRHVGKSTRSPDVVCLDVRTPSDEDTYCWYMTSRGIRVLARLLRMTKMERRAYTLAEFARFWLAREPLADVPHYTDACSKCADQPCRVRQKDGVVVVVMG
ncbi:hypothetical protein F4677DRAFT_443253 [Hypoxylon crocopeplum]|nr:hypothetical protein F4677DRAFT_443253 [Hypoxylon crocopeplum]